MGYIDYHLYPSGLSNTFMSLEMGVILSHLLDKPLLLKNLQPIIGGNSFKPKHHYRHPVSERIPSILDLFDVPVQTFTAHNTPEISDPSTLDLFYKDDRLMPLLGACVVCSDRPLHAVKLDPIFQEFLADRSDVFLLDEAARNADVIFTLRSGYLGNYESIFYIENKQTRHDLFNLLSDLKPKQEYLEAADTITRELGKFSCLHIRLSDYKDVCHSDATTILQNISLVVPQSEKLVILTDESEDKTFFVPITDYFTDTVFLDEFIVNEHQDLVQQLPFSDNIVIALLSQYIGRHAKIFIGHPASTYSGLIQRLRFYDDLDETNRFAFSHDDYQIDNELKNPVVNPGGQFTWNKLGLPYGFDFLSWSYRFPECATLYSPKSEVEISKFKKTYELNSVSARELYPIRVSGFHMTLNDKEFLLHSPENINPLVCNPIAALIWDICDSECTIELMINQLQEHFNEPVSTVEQGVLQTLDDFQNFGALEISKNSRTE